MDIKQLILQIESFKGLLATRDAEVKALGDASKATQTKLSAYEVRIDDLKKEVEKEVKAREGLEAKGGRPFGSPSAGDLRKKLHIASAMFAEAKAGYKTGDEVRAAFEAKQINMIDVKVPGGTFAAYAKALAGGLDAASAAALASVNAIADPTIIVPTYRKLTLEDLMGSRTISGSMLRYLERTRFNHIYAELIDAVMIAGTSINVANANGFYEGQEVVIERGVAGKEETLTVDSVDVDATPNVITFTTGFQFAHAASTTTTRVEATSDTFAFTPETNLKPNANIQIEEKTEDIKTLAHGIELSRTMLEDYDQLQVVVENDLINGIKQSVEYQILYGPASTPTSFLGIMSNPRCLEYAWADGAIGDTQLDAIRHALTLATLANYEPTGVILNPIDWARIETLKGSDGHYLRMLQDGKVWNLPVVVTAAIKQGDALIGAFGTGAILWNRQAASVQLFNQHKDLAAHNMVYLLGEERKGMTTPRPESFVRVDLSVGPDGST